MVYTNDEIMKILDIGIALSKEKDRNKLLDLILEESISIAHCDIGTLYIYRDGKLYFHVMKTISKCGDKRRAGEKIEPPPIPINPENICAYAVLTKQPLNIKNVYESDAFDFSGLFQYDRMVGYHTESMLTIPLLNQEEDAVGVLQLINATNEGGDIIPFDSGLEHIILSLASQAAIAVSNIRYMEEIKEQMWSFTEAMAETIDTRTPYNANHVRMVANYAGKIADYFNEQHALGLEKEYFSQKRKEQLILGALLHDIGKVSIPIKVMNKATRLESRLQDIELRFELFRTRYRVQLLEGDLDESQYQAFVDRLDKALSLVEEVNSAGLLSEEMHNALEEILFDVYKGKEGEQPYFTQEERDDLMIRKGTLTEAERHIMESHVEMTERILAKVHFDQDYQDAVKWAVQHHECLDGSGYPKHLTAEELSTESRILAVADVCDALLATDRPYKKPIPREDAFAIMYDMAKQGKIEEKLVYYLEQCLE